MRYRAERFWPKISHDALDIMKLFGPECQPIQKSIQVMLQIQQPILGCDLEYNEPERYREVPTVLGVSDGFLTVSVPFDEGISYFQDLIKKYPDVLYVGHAFTSADVFAFRQAGVEINVSNVQDTILWHTLTNSHLNKTITKTEDGDGIKKGKGYMNLWTFVSLYTSLPNWKDCIGEENGCDGSRPCWEHNFLAYNAIDSLAPVLALPNIVKRARIRRVDSLYPLHRDLAYILAEMARFGVQVDREYLFGEGGLQSEFDRQKSLIEQILPFNPKSNKASLEYFKTKNIVLKDWQESTIREACEESDDVELSLCLDYKDLGNGTSRWFAPVEKDKSGNWKGYLDREGKIHPRLGFFTSTARLNCVSPNLQNLSARRMDRHNCECGEKVEAHPTLTCEKFKGVSVGKMVRRAIVASPGFYLIECDFSNAENRTFLHMSGHSIPLDVDGHTQTAQAMQLTPDMEFVIRTGGGKVRQAAKSINHGSLYLEGLQLKWPAELKQGRIVGEIECGAREVWPEWVFDGKVVTFTGANLAQRAYGDKSWENRAKANAMLKKFFSVYPGAREFQRKICADMARQNAIVTPHKYYLQALGDAEGRMKTCAAMFGSNPVAHFTKLALVKMWAEFIKGRPMRPILQIHDALMCEVRDDVPWQQAREWAKEAMEVETPEIPGLIIPTDFKYSQPKNARPNWRDMTEVKD